MAHHLRSKHQPRAPKISLGFDDLDTQVNNSDRNKHLKKYQPLETNLQKNDTLVSRLEGDFLELSRRKCSTSTPFSSRLQGSQLTEIEFKSPSALQIKEKTEQIHSSSIDDSGVCDKYDSVQSPDVQSPAVYPCLPVLSHWKSRPKPHIRTPEEKHHRLSTSPVPFQVFDVVCDSVESDLASLPLPDLKMVLLSQFEDSGAEGDCRSQEGDSAYEDYSSFASQTHPRDDHENLSQTSDYHSLELDFPSSVSSSFDLDFEPSLPDEAAAIAFEKLLERYSPQEPDRLIGRKMGCGCMDIVGELSARNMTEVLNCLLGYVSDADLCRMSMVSHSWKDVISSNPAASQRKSQCSKLQSLHHDQKENQTHKKSCRSQRGLTEAAKPCLPVQCTGLKAKQTRSVPTPTSSSQEPQLTKSPSKAQQFWKEAGRLHNDQSLRRCPRCTGPARTDTVQERACCTSSRCGHDFCIKCLLPFHQSLPCPGGASSASRSKPATTPSVGSRKSKKNLRRL